MSASTATTPARPALDGNGSFESLRLLSEYGGEAQYPGWGRETTEQDFRDAQQIAVTIVQYAERRIPEILEYLRGELERLASKPSIDRWLDGAPAWSLVPPARIARVRAIRGA